MKDGGGERVEIAAQRQQQGSEMYENVIKFHPHVTRPILEWGISSDNPKKFSGQYLGP